MEVAFSAERSIQDAIVELSEAESYTVIISYGLMFLYVAIALGKIKELRSFLVHSKVTLAFGGILLVLSSVLCSLGLFGYIGVETTMLTIEVVPFLILAVGVDNLFILVHANRRVTQIEKDQTASEVVADTLSEAGPSILLSALSQGCCFGIGALTDMPAVKTFALYAMVAVFFNLLLQITAFIALMAIDLDRFRVIKKKNDFWIFLI